MTLTPTGFHLWIHTQPFAMQGIEMGARSTLVEYAPNELLLIGPGPETVTEAASIDKLGKLQHILAPNAFHHLYLPVAAKHWPEAKIWAPGAVAKKQPALTALNRLQPDTVFPWDASLESLCLQGLSLQEYVFYHAESRSLVVTDLVFNVLNPQGWKAHAVTFVMGTRGKLACSRLVKRLALKDKNALRQSVQRILDWDFERIIMAHGEVLEKNAKMAFTKAMAFVLE